MLSNTSLQAILRAKRTVAERFPDRDGLYVIATPRGTVSFKWDFYMGGRNGRRGTLAIGQYPIISLAQARDLLLEAKKDVASGIDPSKKKVAAKRAARSSGTFRSWWMDYLAHADLADSTKAMRCAVFTRDLDKTIGNLLLTEITEDRLRDLFDRIVERGAPAVAIHCRDICMSVFDWARARGTKIENVSRLIPPTSIARFKPRERNLSPEEIKTALHCFRYVGANVQVKTAAKLLLLTFVRKSELAHATWDEIDFERRLWTIPADRMKKRTLHVVPLSDQAFDLLVSLKTLAGSSPYVLPGRYDPGRPMSGATFNQFFSNVCEAAKREGFKLEHFGPHDLRRTASTLLHEAGFASDWIEKQLAHGQRGVRAVYNKAQYLEQRRQMMPSWADMIDAYRAS